MAPPSRNMFWHTHTHPHPTCCGREALCPVSIPYGVVDLHISKKKTGHVPQKIQTTESIFSLWESHSNPQECYWVLITSNSVTIIYLISTWWISASAPCKKFWDANINAANKWWNTKHKTLVMTSWQSCLPNNRICDFPNNVSLIFSSSSWRKHG
jgi:hypothetical protein